MDEGRRAEGLGEERLRRVRKALAPMVGGGLGNPLCGAARGIVKVSGLAVAVGSGENHRGRLCWSDPVAGALEDLQDTVGQGPSLDAHRRGVLVAEPRLAHRRVGWEAFVGPALALGVEAVWAFPMRVGAVRLGVMSLYQASAGDLSEDQYADARAVADIVTEAIINVQAAAPPGDLAEALEVVGSDRAEVHRATGMVAARLGIGVGEALVRLRARAFADGKPLLDVARDVLAQKLRIE